MRRSVAIGSSTRVSCVFSSRSLPRGLAAFYGISFRLHLPKFIKFRCGSLLGRDSVRSTIPPYILYFGFILFLIFNLLSQRLAMTIATMTAVISATATRPERDHSRLETRPVTSKCLEKREDTAAQGG
jgi:hypothetical protein